MLSEGSLLDKLDIRLTPPQCGVWCDKGDSSFQRVGSAENCDGFVAPENVVVIQVNSDLNVTYRAEHICNNICNEALFKILYVNEACFDEMSCNGLIYGHPCPGVDRQLYPFEPCNRDVFQPPKHIPITKSCATASGWEMVLYNGSRCFPFRDKFSGNLPSTSLDSPGNFTLAAYAQYT